MKNWIRTSLILEPNLINKTMGEMYVKVLSDVIEYCYPWEMELCIFRAGKYNKARPCKR